MVKIVNPRLRVTLLIVVGFVGFGFSCSSSNGGSSSSTDSGTEQAKPIEAEEPEEAPVQESVPYTISGEFAFDPPGDEIKLERVSATGGVSQVGISKVDKENSFSFEGERTGLSLWRLNFMGNAFPFVVDNDSISFVVDNPRPGMLTFDVAGSEGSSELSDYMRLNGQGGGAPDKLNSLRQDYIRKNAPSFATLKIMELDFLAQPEANYDFIKEMGKVFEKGLSNLPQAEEFVTRASELRKGPTTEGNVAPDFTLPNTKGEMVSLSDFRGNYVLVDFWASWCGPCRMENPNVVKNYEKYHSAGLEILSVSLDKDKGRWLQAIERDGLTWNHVSDLKYWDSKVVPLYGIQGIPFMLLLDKEGKIVAKNLRGKALDRKLSKIYNY